MHPSTMLRLSTSSGTQPAALAAALSACPSRSPVAQEQPVHPVPRGSSACPGAGHWLGRSGRGRSPRERGGRRHRTGHAPQSAGSVHFQVEREIYVHPLRLRLRLRLGLLVALTERREKQADYLAAIAQPTQHALLHDTHDYRNVAMSLSPPSPGDAGRQAPRRPPPLLVDAGQSPEEVPVQACEEPDLAYRDRVMPVFQSGLQAPSQREVGDRLVVRSVVCPQVRQF